MIPAGRCLKEAVMRHFHFEYRNYLELSHINHLASADPAEFVRNCEASYRQRVEEAADLVVSRMGISRVVMLAGPSSSGKTTTAHRLTDALKKRGIHAETISMDDYFLTIDRTDTSIDYEAPERMDIALLRDHIALLDAGAEIHIPYFDFTTGIQSESSRSLRLGNGDVAIFEGIHALSDLFCTVGDPTGIYISARMRVTNKENIYMPPEWLRFVRRCVRDELFRDSSFLRTLGLWKNVRRGEVRYILPSKENAHVQIDTSLAYEPCLFAPFAVGELESLPEEELDDRELSGIAQALSSFVPIDPSLVPEDSLMREFIGEAGTAIVH